ncbi:hypothetical protein [Streptomyces scabiei]|uniref:hypothetical protein n=1 Tax=Streptomyces scabiei TaxID=1930 RepID=UPI0004E63BC4|nr:hypothetical protein [Streptomyces scabiei]KFG05595.1 hypothetical protein IQ61_29345 [Streptomyces scabiei]MDX2829454.1 hypothetical protein [Streptomyces scabiei]MDX3674990.1 hypothetical protein [Streptomyces scabiei]
MAAEGFAVHLPGLTPEVQRRAQEQARAGNIHAPEIWRLVEAMSALIGHSLDPSTWGDEDLREFTRWVGLVDADEWSGVDEQELTSLLQGGGRRD